VNVPKCPDWTTLEELTSAKDWGNTRLRALGLSPLAEHQIVKHCSISVVWRQQITIDQAVFLKVVPLLFAQEPLLTEWLSQRWPANVPEVLAIETYRRWLLTRAVEGVALSELDSVDHWMSAVRVLARIQIDSIGAAELVECGCPSRDLAALADELDLLLSETIPFCARHNAKVADDVVHELHALRRSLVADASLLAAFSVPTTLVHGDFYADNVIISSRGASPVIIDWTDGARSHPFFDLLILLRGRAAKRVAAHRETLVRAYLSEWAEAGGESADNLREAFLVAQRLAPLYHAASYRRIFGIGTAAATEFAEALPWLLGLLVEASSVNRKAPTRD
jgi:aminoglycoside phosphotransferase (APT) family kinase protein